MDWTEFRISVKTGAVEAVTNLIHESGAGGVVIEHNDNQTSTISAYFPVGQESDSIAASLDNLWLHLESLGISAEAKVDTAVVAEQDWAEEWKKYYHPVRVGSIIICPSWLSPENGREDIVVELDPGMAFGTGTHPTTQMCISEIACAEPAGKTVLDLGCGSGILSIVAAKLGAAQVDAVDNDRIAVEVAAENARRNQCTVNQINGDAFALFKESNHDLVVANIGLSACAKLAEIYVQEHKKCTLILSGFPAERLSELSTYTEGKRARISLKDDWGCLVMEEG